MREFELLKIVEELFGCEEDEELRVPAGSHDAAYIKFGDTYLVLTCDTVNEISDFPPYMSAEEMGEMAVAVTLSDLAACGSSPMYFLSSISIKEADKDFFKGILKGIRNACNRYGVKVAGGDIDFAPHTTIAGFAVGITDKIVTRSGARPGEKVYVTAPLGKAQLCLEMLSSGLGRERLPYPDSLYRPIPRINEGKNIARFAGALTDISDSLAVSLHQIAESSGVRIVLERVKLPLAHLTKYVDQKKSLDLFLYGGGDYELIFTADDRAAQKYGIEIGYVKKGKGVYIQDEDKKLQKVEMKGYSHFDV